MARRARPNDMKNSVARVGALTPASVNDELSPRSGLALALFRARGSDAGDRVAAIVTGLAQASAGGIEVTDIDAQARPALAARYFVTDTPTVLLLKDGVVVDRVIGAATRSLLERLLQTRAPRERRTPFRPETGCSVWKHEPAQPVYEVPVNAAVGGGIEVECAHGT
jgi:thioredoxin 1